MDKRGYLELKAEFDSAFHMIFGRTQNARVG